MAAPTFNDLFRTARNEVLARNVRISREVIEREGTDANALVSASAAVGDEAVGEVSALQASLFLDSAKGSALDLLVFDRFNLTRKAASPARGTVDFYTATPALATFTIPAGTRVAAFDGREYLTTVAATYTAGSLGPLLVPVRSTLAGAAQQATIGSIQSIVSTFTGKPADLAVANTLATAGATNAEEDDELRARARLVLPNARRGTLQAIEAGARAVGGVRSATAFEVVDALGRPAGAVQVVIADKYTDQLLTVSPTPAAYAEQSQALANEVVDALDEVRAGGIYVSVIVGAVVLVTINLALTYRAGSDTAAAEARAIGTITAMVNALAPGAALTRAAMTAALQTIPDLIVDAGGGDIVVPSGDVVPGALEVLRTSPVLVRVVG